MDIFIGRFHPLLVHLPIGFILLAFILESVAFFRRSVEISHKLISLMYLAGFAVSVATVITGFELSSHEKFIPAHLNIHKWMGITVMIVTLFVVLTKWYRKWVRPTLSYSLSIALVILVTVTGHLGGVITHGENYLFEHAPRWVQNIAGYAPEDPNARLSVMQPDSIEIYTHILRPLLDSRCTMCHNAQKRSGGFDASTYTSLFEEAETGKPLVARNVTSSELFRRVTLSPSHQKFMPPDGVPLSFAELNILEYWIAQGADSVAHFDHTTIPGDLMRLLNRDYGLDYTPRPYYEKVKVDSLGNAILDTLEVAGFRASFLGATNFLLDIEYTADTLHPDGLEALQTIRNHVAFLDLSGVVIEKDALIQIKDFTNLIRLDLHGTNVDNNVFDHFSQLTHLEVLNLYGTPITAYGLQRAVEAPALQRVYIWQTAIPSDSLMRIRNEYPKVKIDHGFLFEPVSQSVDSIASQD